MTTNIRPVVTTVVAATISGAVAGGVVATAMDRNLHTYMRFVGLIVIITLGIAAIWAYRTYIKPQGAHAEQSDVEATP